MDHPDPEEHPDTPRVSVVKEINLKTAFSPNRRTQYNKYVWRRAREAGQTPISVKRLSKAARTRAAPADKDEMHAYVKEEMAKLKARMQESMNAFESEMRGEMHTLGISMYAKWKEEMQTYEGKSQKEMTAHLKTELVPLEGKIHAFMAKDMLKLDAAKEWILALEDAIEYASGQGAGNQSMQAAAQITCGRQGQSDEIYRNPYINRLEVVDGTGISSNPQWPLGQGPDQIYLPPPPGNLNFNPQQNEQWRGPETWNGVTSPETTAVMDPTRQNFMGTHSEPYGANAQEYLATSSGGGSYSQQETSRGNNDHLFGVGPPNVFAGSQMTTSGFAPWNDPFQRTTGASSMPQGVMQGNFSPEAGAIGGRYTDNHQEAYGYPGPRGTTQRAFDNTGNFQSNMQGLQAGKSTYVDRQHTPIKVPMSSNSYMNQPNSPCINQPFNIYAGQRGNMLGIAKANHPYLNSLDNAYVDQQNNLYKSQQTNVTRVPNANNPYINLYGNQQNSFLSVPNANNPYVEQPSSPIPDQRNNALRAPIANDRYMDQQGSGFRVPMDTQNNATRAPVTKDFVNYTNSKTPLEIFKAPGGQPMLASQNPYELPLGMGSPGNSYGSAQDRTVASVINRPGATSGGFATLGNPAQFDSSGGVPMRGKGVGNTSYGSPYASQAGRPPFPG
ncbi:hypothetical protein L7F22_013748 [Adiantum nelumboides]|nr:hypothetical protein [Adiantum nelumboides]